MERVNKQVVMGLVMVGAVACEASVADPASPVSPAPSAPPPVASAAPVATPAATAAAPTPTDTPKPAMNTAKAILVEAFNTGKVDDAVKAFAADGEWVSAGSLVRPAKGPQGNRRRLERAQVDLRHPGGAAPRVLDPGRVGRRGRALGQTRGHLPRRSHHPSKPVAWLRPHRLGEGWPHPEAHVAVERTRLHHADRLQQGSGARGAGRADGPRRDRRRGRETRRPCAPPTR